MWKVPDLTKSAIEENNYDDTDLLNANNESILEVSRVEIRHKQPSPKKKTVTPKLKKALRP